MGFQHTDQKGKKNFAYKHGMTGTRTYNSWVSMLGRVDGKDHYSYLYVNVKVCKRWRKFSNFLEDMGVRPLGRTIDRYPDNKGDYKPSNCRWATPKEQFDNSAPRPSNLVYKNAKFIWVDKKKYTKAQAARNAGISIQCLNYRLSVGIPITKKKYGPKGVRNE